MQLKKYFKRQEKSSVAFFSLEMSSEQLSTRILSEQAKIKSNDIKEKVKLQKRKLIDILKHQKYL